MKKRMILAALLLLVFGTMKAQVNEPKPIDPKTDSIMKSRMAELSQSQEQFAERMREMGVVLQQLSDSVNWEKFERDMEQWGKEMEQWGRKMEQWGAEFEKQFEKPYNNQPSKKDDSQVHAIQVEGSGDVRIEQNPRQFLVIRDGWEISNYVVNDGVLLLAGSDDWNVTLQQLDKVVMRSSGDVYGLGTLKGRNLDIKVFGSGDLRMDVDYDTIWVQIFGSGDVSLKGKCNVLYAELAGSGDLEGGSIECRHAQINETGSGRAWTNKSGNVAFQEYRRSGKGLFLNPCWNGFEAGLNMLFNTPADVTNMNDGAQGMEIKPLRSWYFGFNIADVGVAFNRKHTAGIFTGVGIGWNNFSWNNDVTIEFDPDNVVYTLVPIDTDKIVKTSKYGALFLQVPLMVEIRPTRSLFIDAGVTGGLRFAQWNRVKLADGSQIKRYSAARINQFKLDASFRIGYDMLGFFANYSLLPIFDFPNSKVHPFTFGFSINF